MDRRVFLRLTGSLAATVAAFEAFPAAAQGLRGEVPLAVPTEPLPPMRAPGFYQFSGRVQLQEPMVSITGITNAQQISWAGNVTHAPSASFSSFEYFSEPWRMPDVRVRGGRLEALSVTPVDLA